MAKTLVLHGYGQQVEIVKKKWQRTFKKLHLTDVSYVEAPLTVINKKSECGYGWFLWHDDNDCIYNCEKYHQVEESLQYLHDYITKHGPFDTIIGYSQGGTILSILLDRFPITVRKVIIISSYEPLDLKWTINHTTATSTLIVAGAKDEIVPMRYTTSIYNNATVYIHDGGHSLPNTKEFITKVREFLI